MTSTVKRETPFQGVGLKLVPSLRRIDSSLSDPALAKPLRASDGACNTATEVGSTSCCVRLTRNSSEAIRLTTITMPSRATATTTQAHSKLRRERTRRLRARSRAPELRACCGTRMARGSRRVPWSLMTLRTKTLARGA